MRRSDQEFVAEAAEGVTVVGAVLSDPRDDAVTPLLRTARLLFRARAVAVAMPSVDGSRHRVVVDVDPADTDGDDLPPWDDVRRQIVRHGAPVLLDAVSEPRDELPHPADAVAVPCPVVGAPFAMSPRGAAVGALMIVGGAGDAGYAGHHVDACAELAALIGSALHHQRVLERTRGSADALRRLQAVSRALSVAVDQAGVARAAVEVAAQALDASAGALAVMEPDGVSMRVVGVLGPLTDTLLSLEDPSRLLPLTEAAASGLPVVSQSLAETIARWPAIARYAVSDSSLVALPLFAHGQVCGAVAWSFPVGAAPIDDLRELLTMSDQLAGALMRVQAGAAEAAVRTHAGLLADLGAATTELLENEQVAATACELLVDRGLCHTATMHVLSRQGGLQMAGLAHATPEGRRAAEAVYDRYQPQLEHLSGVGWVASTGREEERLHPEWEETVEGDEVMLALTRAVGVHRVMLLPLTHGGRVHGVLSVGWSHDTGVIPHDVRVLLREVARRAAAAVDTADLYRRTRASALTLQRSLLPRHTVTPGLQTASRYLPASGGDEVGGDWTEVVPMDGDRVLLVVGDVMGHGVRAAALMGSTRAVVRAFALQHVDPAEVLRRASQVLERTQEELATCCLVSLDLRTGRAVVASAGHPPPLLVSPDGTASLLPIEPGPPLGAVVDNVSPQTTLYLERGTTLLMYTDGLIEGRESPIDEGLSRLVEAGGGRSLVPEALCRHVLTALGRDRGHDDDVALLAARLLPAAPTTARQEPVPQSVVTLPLSGERREVRAARHLTRMTVREWRLAELSDDAMLIVTELVTNVTLHGRTPASLVLRRLRDALRIEVSDSDPTPLNVQTRSGLDEHLRLSGRGLRIVATLAGDWGFDPLPGERKVVWAELRAQHESPQHDSSRDVVLSLDGLQVEPVLAALDLLDDLVREALMESHTAPGTRSLLERLAGLREMRSSMRDHAHEARRAGRSVLAGSVRLSLEQAIALRRDVLGLVEVLPSVLAELGATGALPQRLDAQMVDAMRRVAERAKALPEAV